MRPSGRAGSARYGRRNTRSAAPLVGACLATPIGGARMNHDPRSHEAATEELVSADEGQMPYEPDGSVRAALANAMVRMKKQYYGRGPTAAKAWLLDDYVFIAMEGGLTRNEETLVAAGKEDRVRNSRIAFREAMSDATIAAAEEITGRKVLTYHSQIMFGPTRAFEISALEPARGDDG